MCRNSSMLHRNVFPFIVLFYLCGTPVFLVYSHVAASESSVKEQQKTSIFSLLPVQFSSEQFENSKQLIKREINVTEITENPNTQDVTSSVGEISRKKCAEYISDTKSAYNGVPIIVGGTKSLAKEFPHMAVLGYGNDTNIQWSCGGSLISPQFVLTAAHCLSTPLGPVKFVRLGDLDLQSTSDDADPQEFTVIEAVAHPQFKPPSTYHDIALLKLDRPVKYTDYVKPACLPITKDVFVNVVATGWGTTEAGRDLSPHLLKVNLELFSHNECSGVYQPNRRLKAGIANETQFCAGGRGASKDTCQGDSGGPLQKAHQLDSLYDIIGITSFAMTCGASIPGVYTRIEYYIPWIEKVVWSE